MGTHEAGHGEILAALEVRVRRRKVAAAAAALLIVLALGFVGYRVNVLSEAFPNPMHEEFEAGAGIRYPGQGGVSLRVAPAKLLGDGDVKRLCPDLYSTYEQEDDKYRLVRVDVTVRNGSDRDFELFDLRSSALVIGSVYGNASFEPAEAEAFPDIDYSKLAPGDTVTLPLLFMVWDYTLPKADWEEMERAPIKLQFSTWPRVMSADIGS